MGKVLRSLEDVNRLATGLQTALARAIRALKSPARVREPRSELLEEQKANINESRMDLSYLWKNFHNQG